MPTVTRRTANVIAAVLALALVGGLVIRTSSAVFTAETDNTGNSLEAGTLVLTDDDGGAVAFRMRNVAPGERAVECVRVIYEGTLDPEPVRFYSTSAFVTRDENDSPITSGAGSSMEQQVNITIEQGDGTSAGTTGYNNCAGFSGAAVTGTTTFPGGGEQLSSWATAHTTYDSGEGSWNPSRPGQSRVYRITLELDEQTGNDFQAHSLEGINIAWGTESTNSPGVIDARP